MTDKKILDIGCGPFKIKGAVGLDCNKMPGVDIIHNIQDYPRPIEDNFFDEIYGQHIIEHVDNLTLFLQEVCRIGKPGAKVILRSPHASCSYSSWTDPTHVRPYTTQSLKYYEDNNTWSYYSNVRIKILKTRLHYICYNGDRGSKMPKFIHRFLTFLANKNQLLCERIWGGWFGGFEEVYFEFLIIK